MHAIVTISDRRRLALIVNLKTGQTATTILSQPDFADHTIEGRPACRPFGISWSSDKLFIVNNRQLLAFDSCLGYCEKLPVRLQVNCHQAAFRESSIWIVSPWTNSLIAVPLSQGTIREFHPLLGRLVRYRSRESSEGDDRVHFNSILWSGTNMFLAAHAFGENSFILRYDAATLNLLEVYQNVGSSIHGLAFDKGALFWLSTGTRELWSSSGLRLPIATSGYARGFAMTKKHFVIATSEFLSRDERNSGDSWIRVLDRKRLVVTNEIQLQDTGSINDLRLLDEYDYAHQIEPFWPEDKIARHGEPFSQARQQYSPKSQ